MAKVVGALRALALLVGIWVVLLVVAHFGGVLPSFPWDLGIGGEAVLGEAADAGTFDAGIPEATTAIDAGVASDEPEARESADTPTGDALPAYAACPAGSLAPTLSTVEMLGGRTQLVVGCGRETHVLALERGGEALVPVRVASFRLRTENLRAEPEGAAAVATDVNADGLADLLIGHLVPASRNAAQQGTLVWIPRDTHGGFDAPVTLAPIAVAALVAADLDASPGTDLVALHQADRFGRRPSEAWVFGGGAAPARTTRLDAGATARVVRILDLDRDARLDVVTLGDGDPGGRIHFGDGEGRFPRNQAIVVAGAREAAVGDLDGDGAEDLVIAGDSVRFVAARGDVTQITAEPLELPRTVSHLHVADVDDDGHADLLGLVGDGVGVLAQTAPRVFEARPLLDVPLASGTIVGLVAAELGGEARLDLAMLIDAPGDVRGFELVVVADVSEHGVASVAAEPAPIPDAPLTLQVDLR